MRVTLVYEKGPQVNPSDDFISSYTGLNLQYRNDAIRNRIIEIDAVDSPQDNALCPVKWLLIHTLQHGLVQGNDVNGVLLQASQRVDKGLVWTHPKYPVLAGMKAWGVFPHLSKPALMSQLQNTVGYAGLVVGLLVKITPHDPRRGCFRDMMKASVAPSTSLTDVVDVMNHARALLHSGVTARYLTQMPSRIQQFSRGVIAERGDKGIIVIKSHS